MDIIKRLRDWRNTVSEPITRPQFVEIFSAAFQAEDEIVQLRERVKIRDEEIARLRMYCKEWADDANERHGITVNGVPTHKF